MRKVTVIGRWLLVAALPFPLTAQQNGGGAALPSIEDLMNVQVTSVSRREQSLSEVGAAVFVLTAEDIRRSGATNIPDLLRLVPGVDVAQIDAHSWAISIRGFNDEYANKVLVLIDGRSVYSPLTSGVNWDQQDVPLEDIDRIEVIRGPAGTVWGANAVNGVISVTTKKTSANEGALVRGGASSHGHADGLMQYGGAVGTSGAYRLFTSYQNTMSSPAAIPGGVDDDWHYLHGGGRMDLAVTPRDSLTIQGDLQRMEGSFTPLAPGEAQVTMAAGNVLGRWDRALQNGSEISLQTYYDYYDYIKAGFGEIRNTFDVDFHHHLTVGLRHDIVWGVGYRITADQTTAGGGIAFVPANQTGSLFSAFAQDEIRLTNAVSINLGSKIEHNPYTGFEYEPGAQLVLNPKPKQQVWFSAARAIRQPAQLDTSSQIQLYSFPQPSGGIATVEYFGTPHQPSEKSLTYEAGYRRELTKKVSADATVFFSSIHNMLTLLPGDPFPAPGNADLLVIPSYFSAVATAHSYGGELYGTWTVSSLWKVKAAYSMIRIGVDRSSPPGNLGSTDATTPRGQFQIRSLLTLKHHVEWDTSLFQVSALGARGIVNVPAYARLDMRLGRHFGEYADVSIVGQNLLQPTHAEFTDDAVVQHQLIARSVYGKVTWRF